MFERRRPHRHRIALVTGGARGIGRATAQALLADGLAVAIADLDEVTAAHTAKELASRGTIRAYGLDVTDLDAFRAVVCRVEQDLGPIDVLVNNAGIMPVGAFLDLTPASDRLQLDINVHGVLHGMRAAVPVMRRQGSGRIVVTASRNAELCQRGMLAYNASKAAVIAAVRTLAHELRDVDICVNNLIPGVSATGIWGSEEATPDIARDPALAYPTARFLATVPPGGPTGQTWFDMERWPMWKDFDT